MNGGPIVKAPGKGKGPNKSARAWDLGQNMAR